MKAQQVKVKPDNSDIWKFSQELNKELRKERWKKTVPSARFFSYPSRDDYFKKKEYLKVYGSEEDQFFDDFYIKFNYSPEVDITLDLDLKKFSEQCLTDNEAQVLYFWLYCGSNQMEIAQTLGVCQASVSNMKKTITNLLRTYLEY